MFSILNQNLVQRTREARKIYPIMTRILSRRTIKISVVEDNKINSTIGRTYSGIKH
jgi:hypothetical protein